MRPDDRPVPFRRRSIGIASIIAAALILAACNNAPSPARTSAPASSASIGSPAPSAPSESSDASSSAVPAGQTNSDWGRIWDSLPAAFPIYPGAAPAEEAQTGPVSATLAVPGQDARAIASWMQAELERDTYRTEALNGPLEDGSFVLDSVGEAGCRVEVVAAPLGDLTTLTVRYGAACPSP